MNKNQKRYNIKIKNQDFDVIITKKKIKNLVVKLNEYSQIVVSCPSRISFTEALDMLFDHSDWIIKTYLKQVQNYERFEINKFLNKELIYLGGEPYNIVRDDNLNSEYIIKDKTIFYKVNVDKVISKVYEENYKIIEQVFIEVSNHFKPYINLNPILEIRKMKSRWGSCHYKSGKIVINKVLVCVPIELLRFVMIHEFTHFIQPNHSKKYYEILSKFLPNWNDYSKELKKYSFLL